MRRNWLIAAFALALAVAACGGGGDDSNKTASAPAKTAAPAAAAVKCGAGTGQKATGAPIKLGAIATKQPGTDFTDIPNAAKAFFDCVNDNGGINGRPIQYVIETEQTDPGQVASLAKKLVETEKVLGIVGNTSIIECAVNHGYYEQQGFYIIDSGIAPECYSTPNSAPVNMGPRYSVDGATQYLIRQGVKKLVLDQSNVPGTGYNAGGFLAIAKDAGHPDGVAEGERADPGRELGRAQGGPGGRRRRRRRAQLHAAGGAEDPPGRPAAGPAGPREVGLLDAVQHGLPGRRARLGLERQARRQRRAQPDQRRATRTARSTAR